MAQIIKMTKPIRFEVFDLIGWTVACYKQQWDCQKLNYPPGGLPDSSSENAKIFFWGDRWQPDLLVFARIWNFISE